MWQADHPAQHNTSPTVTLHFFALTMCVLCRLLQDSGEEQKERQDLLRGSSGQDLPQARLFSVCQQCRSGHQCVAPTSPTSSYSYSPCLPLLLLLYNIPCNSCSPPLEGGTVAKTQGGGWGLSVLTETLPQRPPPLPCPQHCLGTR